MSSPNNATWTTPIMIVLVGGMAIYGMTRGPGSCPLNPARPAPAESVAMSSAAADSGATLIHADDTSFDEAVLQAEGPVLVDFYADWCGPCQKLAPVLDRVAEDLTEGRIVKVNVDHSPEVASRYDIQSIPTLLVFVDGEVVEKTMGMQSESEIRELLQQ
jgi:thioredoxin 1